jgi:hypothetical protein
MFYLYEFVIPSIEILSSFSIEILSSFFISLFFFFFLFFFMNFYFYFLIKLNAKKNIYLMGGPL